MDIDSGSRMIVEFSNKERFNCLYVGQVEDEFVLLKTPMTPGIRNRLIEGAFLQFRYLREGRIIGFGAEVLRFQAAPASLVFISYPREFSEYNLRNEGRLECRFPGGVVVKGSCHSGHVVDISPNGCRFTFDHGMPDTRGLKEIGGWFATMEGGKKYDFQGDIVARRVSGNQKRLGIRFTGDIVLPDGVNEYFGALPEKKRKA